MGSWSELDAIYPPGSLSPASALVATLGHVMGAVSVYHPTGYAASWVPEVFQADRAVLDRAEHWLQQPPEALWEGVRTTLFPQQRLVIALQVLDRATISAISPIKYADIMAQLCITEADLAPYRAAIAHKNDLSLFPQ